MTNDTSASTDDNGAKNKLILSLDGGGIRGVATAQFLMRVEQALMDEHGKSIRDCVDFYAGASTGSIIALALATTGLTVDKISSLYDYKTARTIFTENKGWFEFDRFNAPKYEASGKTRVLAAALGKATIGTVPEDKHVLVTTYAIERRKPLVIKSTEASHRALLSCEVADASSAAPTYFPTRDMGIGTEKFWLVDGGVVANNPTMCAIAEARKAWDGIGIDNLRVLSIGTGYRTRKINGPDSRKWGVLGWAFKGDILNILTDERAVAYQALTITRPGTCIRVNSNMSKDDLPDPPPDDAMDDFDEENIKRLRKMGDFWYAEYGPSAIALLLNNYRGPSLDTIKDGAPKQVGPFKKVGLSKKDDAPKQV